jgi:GNAT superfamily N-acetyltransferase
VAETDGGTAGFAAVLLRSDGEIELDGLFVDPAFQRQGIGRVLCRLLRRIWLGARRPTLHVIGNTHARAFYDACGFVGERNAEDSASAKV